MSDDLVKRLRAAAKHPMMDNNCKADVFDVADAADRIEELEAKALANKIAIMRLEAERNKFQLYLQRTHADLELEIAAVDGLNAKLAKAIEVIDNAATLVEDRHFLYMNLSGRDPKNCSSDLSLIAEEIRLASTELKGQDYE